MAVSREQQVIDAYQGGASVREAAALVGVSERTVRVWLHAAGVQMRARGQRPVGEDVTEQVVAMRRRGRLSWAQIAGALGISTSVARRAYQRATGDKGRIDHHGHLSAKQTDRLRELHVRVPELNRGLATRSSEEGRRLADQLRAHRKAGVTLVELGAALGMSPAGVRAIIVG